MKKKFKLEISRRSFEIPPKIIIRPYNKRTNKAYPNTLARVLFGDDLISIRLNKNLDLFVLAHELVHCLEIEKKLKDKELLKEWKEVEKKEPWRHPLKSIEKNEKELLVDFIAWVWLLEAAGLNSSKILKRYYPKHKKFLDKFL